MFYFVRKIDNIQIECRQITIISLYPFIIEKTKYNIERLI